MKERHEMTNLLNALLLAKDADDAAKQLERKSINWEQFLAFLEKNKVTVRALQRLQELGEKLPEAAEKKLILAEKKKKQKLEVIRKVNFLFADNGVKCVLLKFIESLPDLGRDTDYLVGKQFKDAASLIKAHFPARAISLSLSDRLTRTKSSFFLGEVELELYGRISQIGETYFQSSKIIERGRETVVDNVRIVVPRFEDGLLITCVHAMYRHRRVKYSELLVATKAICSDNLDWEYIFENASQAGIVPGLFFFLHSARQLLSRYSVPTVRIQDEFWRGRKAFRSCSDPQSKSILWKKIL